MRIIDYKTDREIQSAGYECLREGLGATGLIRFMQQFEKGKGNYTQDRSLWQKDYSVDDLVREIETRKLD